MRVRGVGGGGWRRRRGHGRWLQISVDLGVLALGLHLRTRTRVRSFMTAASRRCRLSVSVYPYRPIAMAGKVVWCRAELFMLVQVHNTLHLAAAPGARGSRGSQQGVPCRRTLATTLVGGKAAHACRLNDCVEHHVERADMRCRVHADVRMLTMSLDN